MGVELKGGKTAPKLLQDLNNCDPRQPVGDGRDGLTVVPFHDFEKDDIDPPLKKTHCRHRWAIKSRQSDFPEDFDPVPSPATAWKLACYCVRCRIHLDFSVTYDIEIRDSSPCPNAARPLHHLVYCPHSMGSPAQETQSSTEVRPSGPSKRFRCTAANCGAQLTVRLRPPRLSNDWVSLLTDRYIIKSRAEKAIAQDPEKFQGHAPPSPGTVLETFSRYVNGPLSDPEGKPYPRDGKSWLLNFGDPCASIMEYLGYTSDGGLWQRPKLDSNTSIPFVDPQRVLLDDVLTELNVLMLNRPDDERRTIKFNFAPMWAEKQMRLALACNKYKEALKSRNVDLTADEHPSYAGLGSVADFHDDLIYFAYERQIYTDPDNTPYYLECLQMIAEGRKSDFLMTQVGVEASNGRLSPQDIRSAYRHLGLDPQDSSLEDENIIGSFHARLSDSPVQEAELRRDLKVIGQHRSSHKIQSVAAQTVSTYEQALAYLGAQEDINDDFITTMYTVKIGEKSSEEATARQAVALIANHRKSRALKRWLDTGSLGEVEMDIGQAYHRLDISDRNVTDDVVLASFDFNTAEQPSQTEELNRALAKIAEHRSSKTLMERSGLNGDGASYPLKEWPVALNNIGNTCYLNSLLQFYFSIHPFRNLLLNIDEYKTSTDDDDLKSKRIGGRIVAKREVERAQRLAEELKKLFGDLIAAPTYTVRPDTEVARLTLLTPKAEIARRQSIRQSMNNGERPRFSASTGVTNGTAVQGASDPPEAHAVSDDSVMHDSPVDVTGGPQNQADRASNNSSETLVDGTTIESATPFDKAAKSASSEIHHGARPASQSATYNDAAIYPLTESPPPGQEEDATMQYDAADIEAINPSQETSRPKPAYDPPSHPPPVPPRPKPTVDPDEIVREAEFAAQQQDVNEIAYNVLNQIQCAIKPESTDRDGEQLDQVKGLFYGKQKSHITSRLGMVRTKEEYISDIKVNVQGGPSEIYAALDGAFDVEDVAVAGGIEPKYYTISQLPPILQIHVQRGQYDPQTKKQFKSESHLDFKEIIYMDRYMDSEDKELLRRRKESWEWKRQLTALETRRDHLLALDMDMTMSDVLRCAGGYFRQLDRLEGEHSLQVPPDLSSSLEKAASDAVVELEDLESSIKDLRTSISTQFSDMRQIPYRLAAVFVHRGSSNAGHYWIYIYDFQANFWRNYNDERVTKVTDTSEIFGAPTGPRPPTPYFLVYVKDDLKEHLINPVCRDVAEIAPEEVKDVAMEDYEPIDLNPQIEATYRSSQLPTASIRPIGQSEWDDRHIGNTGNYNTSW